MRAAATRSGGRVGREIDQKRRALGIRCPFGRFGDVTRRRIHASTSNPLRATALSQERLPVRLSRTGFTA